jgi:hypothetical protein
MSLRALRAEIRISPLAASLCRDQTKVEAAKEARLLKGREGISFHPTSVVR